MVTIKEEVSARNTKSNMNRIQSKDKSKSQ